MLGGTTSTQADTPGGTTQGLWPAGSERWRWRGAGFLETHPTTKDHRTGLLRHMCLLDGIEGLPTRQPGDLGHHNYGQPANPFSRPRAWREQHLLGALVPKQPFGERAVPRALDPCGCTRSRLNPVFLQNLCSGSTWSSFGHISGLRSCNLMVYLPNGLLLQPSLCVLFLDPRCLG